MNEAGPRKRGRDGQATRERILREALQLFARKGYDATSVKDISSAVGVADAALYRHFRSKDEIASAIFHRHYGQLARAIGQLVGTEQPFSAILRGLVDLLCALFDEEPDVFAFILLNQHVHLRFVTDEDNVVNALCSIMASAIERGDITFNNAELAAAIALGAAIQPAVFCLYGRLPGPLRTHRRNIEGAVAAALGLQASA